MAQTKKEIVEQLNELGVEFDESQTAKELLELLVKSSPEKQQKPVNDKIYYWFKVRSYVSNDEIKQPGLYCYQDELPRFMGVRLNPKNIEVFHGDIPAKKLDEIASFCGVKTEEYQGDEKIVRSKKELLEILLNQ